MILYDNYTFGVTCNNCIDRDVVPYKSTHYFLLTTHLRAAERRPYKLTANG